MEQHSQFRSLRTNNRVTRSAVSDLGPRLERKCFEFDRDTILRQIDLIHGTIDKNAEELGMVAVEGVFEKPLSDRILRTSRSLREIASQLGALRVQIVKSRGVSSVRKAAS